LADRLLPPQVAGMSCYSADYAALASSVSSTCQWPGRISGARSDSRRQRRRKERSAPCSFKVRVGDTEFNAIARVVHSDREPQLAATVKALFDTKYGWSDGLIAELTPE
jgi:hypothetical protein